MNYWRICGFQSTTFDSISTYEESRQRLKFYNIVEIKVKNYIEFNIII